MREYKIRYKYTGFGFWKSKKIIGSQLADKHDRLTLYFKDGGILEIPQFSKLQIKLGADWVLATKEKMEKESGAKINLEVGK